jgi:Fe-S-cluster containining protein
VAIGKEQQNSAGLPDAHDGTSTPAVSPITAASPGFPQKTNDEGPAFDFAHPEVVARADALRAAAAELRAVCDRGLRPPIDADGYRSLVSELEAVMPAFYLGYDAYVTAVLRTGESAPACSRGCSHCCHHYVASVEPFELIFMHGRVARGSDYPSQVIGLHRRTTLFHSLRGRFAGDLAEDKALYQYYLRGAPCPFLGADGACGVYASRPMSCRMFFSLSDPAFCKGRAVVDARNRNFLIELPEEIEAELARAAAALSAFGLPEFLFDGLLEANSIFGRFESVPEGQA